MADKLTDAQHRALMVLRYGQHWKVSSMRRAEPQGPTYPPNVGIRDDVIRRLSDAKMVKWCGLGMYRINEAGMAYLDENGPPVIKTRKG